MADQHPGWDSLAYVTCEVCEVEFEYQKGEQHPLFCTDTGKMCCGPCSETEDRIAWEQAVADGAPGTNFMNGYPGQPEYNQ